MNSFDFRRCSYTSEKRKIHGCLSSYAFSKRTKLTNHFQITYKTDSALHNSQITYASYKTSTLLTTLANTFKLHIKLTIFSNDLQNLEVTYKTYR